MNRRTCTAAWPVVVTLLLGVSGTAMAEVCTTSTGQPSTFVMTLPSKININPDVVDGTVLTEIDGSLVLRRPTEIPCPLLVGPVPNKYMLTSGAYLGNSTYDSGVPGVGVRLFANGHALPLETPFAFPCKDTNSWPGCLLLVKTGPISQSGSLAGLKRGAYLASNENKDLHETPAPG